MVALSSCSGLLNPYSGSFSCKKTGSGYGKCGDLESTYKRSLKESSQSSGAFAGGGYDQVPQEIQDIQQKIINGKKLTKNEAEMLVNHMDESLLNARSQQGLNEYEREKIHVNASLLRRPEKPIRSPDKIMRVLVLSYVTKNGVWNESRYTHFKVADGDWLIGEELFPKGNRLRDDMLMTPLAEPSTPASSPLITAPPSSSSPPGRSGSGGNAIRGYTPPLPPGKNPTSLPPAGPPIPSQAAAAAIKQTQKSMAAQNHPSVSLEEPERWDMQIPVENIDDWE